MNNLRFAVCAWVLAFTLASNSWAKSKPSPTPSASPSASTSAASALPGKLDTQLTEAELAREKLDEAAYPHFMAFLKTVDPRPNIQPIDPRNAGLIKSSHVFQPTLAMWSDFFKAAAADKLTALRAFGLIARDIKKRGMIVWGPGATFEKAVNENNVDLGLALPATHIGTAIWSPDPSNKDPEFQLHMKLFYTESFIHQFPDHILPANLKIGLGPETKYYMDGQEYVQHTMDTDIYYGPTKGIGFRNVKGVGGQKRGFLGFMQKVLFFLPDAVDSMTINEKKGAMITEAMINTTVEDFEKNPLYSIKIVK